MTHLCHIGLFILLTPFVITEVPLISIEYKEKVDHVFPGTRPV